MRNLALPCLLCVPIAALCYEPERALDNLAAEFSECAAYNILISEAPLSSEITRKSYFDTGTRLMELSMQLTGEKITHARSELAIKTMRREMENNWSNVAIIINKYGYPCKDLVENSDARLRYWLDKKD